MISNLGVLRSPSCGFSDRYGTGKISLEGYVSKGFWPWPNSCLLHERFSEREKLLRIFSDKILKLFNDN